MKFVVALIRTAAPQTGSVSPSIRSGNVPSAVLMLSGSVGAASFAWKSPRPLWNRNSFVPGRSHTGSLRLPLP